MREWKDRPPAQIEEWNKSIVIFLSAVNVLVIFSILFTEQIYISQILGFVFSGLVIYGIVSGKLYSLMKWYAEYKIRKRDNRWR